MAIDIVRIDGQSEYIKRVRMDLVAIDISIDCKSDCIKRQSVTIPSVADI